jgi:hypothetical protein
MVQIMSRYLRIHGNRIRRAGDGMLRQKCSRHEVLHLLMAILIQLLYPVMKGAGPFSLDTYIRLLKRNKTRKADKILDLLNDDPDLVSPPRMAR